MSQSEHRLKKNYSFKDFLFYISLTAVPVLTAWLAVARHSMEWAVFYILFAICMFALVLKFYCTRCPHYTRSGNHLKCLFVWGLPKLFAPRAGKPTKFDMAVAFGAFGAVIVFPIYWLLKEPGMLIVYGLSLGGVIAAVRRSECERCIYFECPANKVPGAVRQEMEG
jgi:hypothetical protein